MDPNSETFKFKQCQIWIDVDKTIEKALFNIKIYQNCDLDAN